MKRAEAFPPHGGRLPDFHEVQRAASVLFDPDGFHELRGLPSGRSRLVAVSDPVGLKTAVGDLADDRGIYYTLNPVRPDLGNKAANVGDVLRRRWLLIDVDRRKLTNPDDSATQEEKDAAWEVTAKTMIRLYADGWPLSVVIDSGNGYHLLYRIDLPNDDTSRKLLSACLKRLALDHDSDTAEIDRKVYNASRISKLPGTWACKGTETAERPYRMAKFLDLPETIEVVSREQLEALAGPEVQPEPAPGPKPRKTTRPEDARQKWLRKALEGECAKVGLAPGGNRHDQLLKSAFALGGLIPAGLDREEAAASLLVVGRRADPGRDDQEKVIRDGLEAGEKEPREVPDFERRPRTRTERVKVGDDGLPDDSEVLTISIDSVVTRPIEWLIPGRIPIGKVTLIAGDPGLGKSFLSLAFISGVTTGGEIPAGEGECFPSGSCVLVTGEDDLDDTVRPRLEALGANLTRVHELSGLKIDDKPVVFNLRYILHLEKAVRRFPDCKLLVIDPVSHFLGGGTDDNKSIQLREVLGPLKDLAARLKIAVLLVHHLNKGGKPKALARVAGSLAYSALARVVWLVIKDQDNPARRLMLSVKNNLSPVTNGLAFTINPDLQVVWEAQPVNMTADEALAEERENLGEPKATESVLKAGSKIEHCEAWLDTLLPPGTEMNSEDILSKAAEKGFGRSTVFVAKKRLGIPARRSGFGAEGGWVWYRAPKASEPPPAQNPPDSFDPL